MDDTIVQFPVRWTPNLDLPPNDFEEMCRRAASECIAVMLERQAKYGPKNIPKRGEAGILTRLDDKLARLDNSDADFTDESRDDTWIDVANYGMIAIMLRRGWWTNEYCPPLRTTPEPTRG